MNKKYINPIVKYAILFWIFGSTYVTIEVFWKMHSHWSMFLLGAICGCLIGGLNNWFPWEMSLIKQGIIGAITITTLELITGLIFNVWLGLGIWDYSTLPLNFMGQICLPFSILWVGFSILAIIVDDYLRYLMFDEKIPEYHLFSIQKV